MGAMSDARRFSVLHVDDHLAGGVLGGRGGVAGAKGDDVFAAGHLAFQLFGPTRFSVNISKRIILKAQNGFFIK